MLKSTSGAAMGSDAFSRTSPVEYDLLTHSIISPTRSPTACQADLVTTTANMSPCGASPMPEE